MTFETILFSAENGIATITINRPDKLNALNHQVFSDLKSAFGVIESDDSIKGVIVTGTGQKAFVAGADITEINKLNAITAKTFSERGQSIFNQIENCTKPVIAAVNGFALGGGCELAMACHIRISAENAKYGQPEVNLGVIPGYGGTQRLVRLIGKGRAMELILTADIIDANEAYRIGLVNKIVPADQLLDFSKTYLSKILSKGLLAVRYGIEAVNYSDRDLADGLNRESSLFGICAATDDLKEGTTAFIEKRPAVFKGK